MRILISGLWAAEQPSGICRSIVSLIRGLNEALPSAELFLALGTWQREYFDSKLGLNRLSVRVLEADIPNRPVPRNLWYLNHLPKLVRSFSPEILHLSFPAPVLRYKINCAIVTTVHDLYPYDRPQNFGYPRVILNRMSLRSALGASDKVICVSKFTLSRLAHYFPEIASTRSLCIPHSIGLSPSALPFDSTIPSPYFLAVAQHRANKNLDLLLKAFRRYKAAKAADPDLRLVIVGSSGPETPRLHKIVDCLSLHEDVLFLTNRSDAEMAALYLDCDLYITLADIEGYGLPLAEALLSGARAVATDIPAHREIAGDHCEYVRLEKDGATRPILAAIEAAGRRPRPSPSGLTNLSPGDVGAKHAAVYNEVLAASKRKPRFLSRNTLTSTSEYP